MVVEAINLRNQRESPLLHLPPEIRNRVYKYTLGGYTITVYPHHFGVAFQDDFNDEEQYRHDEQHDPGALRLTCCFIRHETIEIYFSMNIFEFYETEHYALSQRHLTLPIFRHIRTVSVRVSRDDIAQYLHKEPPYISDSLVRKLQILQRLKELAWVKVTFPFESVADAFSPGVPGSENRSLILKTIKGVFEMGRVGQPVEVVHVTPAERAFAFGKQ